MDVNEFENSDNYRRTKPPGVCFHYVKGICRYGRKGEGCKYQHPPYCEKLLAFGPTHKDGCNKGSSCDFVHPKMCYKSLDKHQCFNAKCRFFHIKGTKRVPDNLNKRHYQGSVQSRTSRSIPSHRNDAHSLITSDQHQNFLGMLQQMKNDLLQEMNNRFSEILSAQDVHYQPPFQHLPETNNHAPQMQVQPHQNPWMTSPQMMYPSQI